KITTYINDNMPTSTGTYLTNIDTANKKLTYQTRTNCPDIFQYEQDGEIDEISTSGIIGQSDYYRGYNGLTNLSNKTPKATTLTVPFTSYVTSHESSDFSNVSMSLIYQSMFFETNTDYWLASRSIGCYLNYVYYRLRFVNNNSLNVQALYISEGTTRSNRSHLCPVVYIPSSVQINVSNDANTLSGTPHLIITE
ncbi:MAG: hypothetical protein J5507_00095, partial [Clostridia bacterium]|nr:hypothetical protein [Clostridia bacterium]